MKYKKNTLSKEQINSIMNLYSNGQFEMAIESIKKLNEAYPNVPLLFNLIGACYKELGQLEGSARMFENAINIKPDYAEAHFNLGVTYKLLGRDDSAIECYEKAIHFSPNYPDAHNNLGTALHDQGRLPSALESLEWAVAYNSNYAEAFNNLGRVLGDLGRTQHSVDSFKKAIALKPDYSNAYFNLASAYQDLGDVKSCINIIQKTLKLEPDWGDAHLLLSRVKKYSQDDIHISQMLSLLNKKHINLLNKIAINFALAYAYEQLKLYDKQFKFLNEANKLRKQESGYSFDKDVIRFKKIQDVFKSPLPAVKKNLIQANSIKPIFIIGMPRSGTSLVHQIIDSHKDVYGAGELTVLSPIISQFFRENDKKNNDLDKSILSIREKYLDVLSRLNTKERIILDKMPLNFRHIGFIFSAFPEAKILHMNRDPMATCWSIYKYYFNGNFYSYNQKDLAMYFGLYKGLMGFWEDLYPNRILDISYEELTTNQEQVTRKILDYCELEWDENCLEFYKNKKAVKTTSSLQVRKKMYQGSSEVWKKYENYLQPLMKGLNY
jgi:tetratricopeptide (TPR) repeat protein